MLTESGPAICGRDGATLDRADVMRAVYADDGVFAAGRHAELEALRAMGARDASLGRLYEGHFNGVLLATRYATRAQRQRTRREVADGLLFGVWNTQGDDPLVLHNADVPGRYRLSGAKTWASGADAVDRALVTARRADGATQMCLVPMDRVPDRGDDGLWRPLGMEASRSFRVSFDGVLLDEDDLIGMPGDYTRDPWFFGGALRFVAVHAGMTERLAAATFAYLASRGRDDDPLQLARAGEMRIGVHAARNWIDAGEAAWNAFDRDPTDAAAARVVDTVDMARLGVERCALDVMERAVRSVGASGLLEPHPFAGLVRDMTTYLRQPAPDAILSRVGRAAFSASAARSAAIASSTGSSG